MTKYDESDPQAIPALVPITPLFDPDAAMAPSPPPPKRPIERVERAAQIIFALWLFLCAIAVLKDGASELAPFLDGSLLTDSPASTLGFGWLAAMLVMSGSPVAVSAIALLDGNAVDQIGAFTMLTGSRLGASFVVLVVALVYALRTPKGTGVRRASMSIGVFALTLTAIVYIPALLIAIPLLKYDAFSHILPKHSFSIPDALHATTGWFVDAVNKATPNHLLFLVGLALLLVSIRLIDRSLPEATDAARLQEHTDWRDRRWVMFGLGSLVAFITMSVSVALTVLVPAVAKGHFKRKQVVSYIMGANITTLGDTLVTSVIIGNPKGVAVVLAELVATTTVTLLIMFFAYARLVTFIERFADWLIDSRIRMLIFAIVLFAIPIGLIILL